MAGVLDGKALAEEIRKETSAGVKAFQSKFARTPCLAAVLVGRNPASQIYVRNKIKACEQAGIASKSHELAADISENQLRQLIHELNASDEVDGILLQLPLPPQIQRNRILDMISPAKDVDGLHPHNVGLLVQGRASLIACTPLGVMEALRRYEVPIAAKNVVMIGRSDLVGKPLALLLIHENATVTICHSKTQDLSSIASKADIVIAAIGKAAYVTPEFIREGAVVIDVGINVLKKEEEIARIFGAGSSKLESFRAGKSVLVGDVHPLAYEKSSLYTPVPGGIGPLTIAMLLRNTLVAAQNLKSGI